MTVGSWKYGVGSVVAALLVISRKINIFTKCPKSDHTILQKEAVLCVSCIHLDQSVNSGSLFHPRSMNKAFSSSTGDLEPLL